MNLPVVPYGPDPRLTEFLEAVRKAILELQKREQIASPSVDASSDQSTSHVFQILSSPVSVDSGTMTQTWTTYDASGDIPQGGTWALIWLHIEVGSSGDQGSIDLRSDSSGATLPGLQTASAQSNTDTDADSGQFWVPLSSSRSFDYEVTGSLSGTDSAWEIELIAYM